VSSRGAAVDFADPALEADVRAGLDTVEAMLRESVKSDYPFVTETSQHLVSAGGKRFRPLVVLLAAQFGDPAAPGVVPAAVVVELTHLATLYHDDVMDEALMRRGADSANSRWGNTVAILTGDFLFARASDILADLGPEAVRLQARTFERLVQGQIRETVGPAESDDLLDVLSESADSGKVPGTDLREGVPTLPVLLLRRSSAPADAELLAALGGDLSEDSALSAALSELRRHPVMDRARAVLEDWAEDARATLAPLPDVPAKAALDSLCDFVVRRTG
jgi:heptaprenyl diphosphate synthase